MQFVAVRIFKPGQEELRQRIEPAHRAWVGANLPPNQFMGPIFADDGTTRLGSVYVVEFPDLAAARAFVAGDPNTQAGLYESILVQPCLNLSNPPSVKAAPKKRAKAKAKKKVKKQVKSKAKSKAKAKAARRPAKAKSRKARRR